MQEPSSSQPGPPRGRFGRPAIGLLADRIDDTFQNELLIALATLAKLRDVNLLCFAGGQLDPDDPGTRARNRVYALASSENVDGLIVSAGSLESRIGTEGIRDYLAPYRPLPLCSIGVKISGTPSIVVDNAVAMRQAVLHLIDDHARHRIAFIQGPEGSEEADQRLGGYAKALRERQLDVDDQLLVEGDFLAASGANGVRVLLDQREILFDAVVAANDEMALGALGELMRRQIRVPETVALVGFDDVVQGRYAVRPLTTVRQSLGKHAEVSIDLILRQLRGEDVESLVSLETQLVTRRSCGCPMEQHLAGVQAAPSRSSNPPASLTDRRAPMLIELLAAAPELSGTKWAERLVDAFIEQLEGTHAVSLTGVLDDLMERVVTARLELRILQPVLTALRRSTVPALVNHPATLLRAEDALHEARVLLANMMRHREVQRRLETARVARVLSDFAQDLITTPDPASAADSVVRFLPALGIRSCILSLYPGVLEGRAAASLDQLQLLVAYDAERPEQVIVSDDVYPTRLLVPRSLMPANRASAHVVQPLCLRGRSLGVALFEVGPPDGAVYESLRAQISAAIERVSGAD
jgi:sigma-B regulation protein RsbU (phosphoserine phosphatase)